MMTSRQMENIQRKLSALGYPRGASAPAQSILFAGVERYALLEWLFFSICTVPTRILQRQKLNYGQVWGLLWKLMKSFNLIYSKKVSQGNQLENSAKFLNPSLDPYVARLAGADSPPHS